ncbi:MAG: type IV pilus assembly protein PilM [bacterium]|nr:MAG: type IV pilus assembly protein PilM [bacterium]
MALFGGSKSLAGLDIGSSSIKVVQLKETGKGYRLTNLGVRPLPQEVIVDGAIMDAGVISDTLREMVKDVKLKGKDVAVSVSGHSVIIKKIKVQEMTEDELERNLPFEAEQYVPFDASEVNMDFVILGGAGGDGKMDVLLVVVKKDVINDLTTVVRDAGLNPVVVDVDAFALENMYETNYVLAPEEVVALVNVGASTTNINIIRDGISIFTRDISVGGNQFTEAIQKQLQVSFEEAEQLKKGRAAGDKGPEEVQSILGVISDNLGQEIQRSLDFFNSSNPDIQISRVALCGGGSSVPGLVQTIEQRLGTQAEIVNPLESISYNRKKFDESYIEEVGPMLGIGVGLAIRKAFDR